MLCACVSVCALCVYTAMPRSAPARRSPVPPPHLPRTFPARPPAGTSRRRRAPHAGRRGKGQAVTAAAMAPAAALTG